MKNSKTVSCFGLVFLGVFLLLGGLATAQTDDTTGTASSDLPYSLALATAEPAATDVSTDEGLSAIPNSPEDEDLKSGENGETAEDMTDENEETEAASDAPEDYDNLQTNLKTEGLTDAFKRIQAIEQENRFQTRRIEKLERDVNDLRNNNSSRTSI